MSVEADCRLTRREVALRLGISTSSVRRLEWCDLHPEQDERGRWRFDPAEFARLEPRPHRVDRGASITDEARGLARRGRVAARVFRLFARNMTLPQIVVATKQPPEVVRELYREWSTDLSEGEWDRRRASEPTIELPAFGLPVNLSHTRAR
jgi:hypothetical protein